MARRFFRQLAGMGLQVIRLQARLPRYAGKHSGTDLLGLVKCEHDIWPALAPQHAMGARLSRDPPADPRKGSEYAAGFDGGPATHAANKPLTSGTASPCSRRSARTRSASDSALTIASAREAP